VECWQQATLIRQYLSSMRQALDAGKVRPNNEIAFAEWFEWATWYADHIDPLVRANARPMAVESPKNKPIDEIEFTSRTRQMLRALNVMDADALFTVTEEQIRAVQYQYSSRIWNEICRVLEGLDYNVADRRYWL
jgi:DNA-directed RNA polymerase alpha subunit